MEPTPFALQLAEPIAYALSTIHGTLNDRTTFDPTRSTRTFALGLSDIGEINFLPKLMNRLHELAPSISVSTLRNTSSNLQDAMEAGHVDLAMGLLPQLKTGYFQRRLFKQRYVCMFRKGHALDKGKISLEEYCAAEHLVVVPPASGHAEVNESIERKGIHRNIRLTVPHYVAVGHILATPGNDLVTTVPESYARQCESLFGLTYVDHPLALPQIDINLFWHAKYHKEPGNKWLRTVIFEIFSDSENVWAMDDAQ
jgi:DNA-binding transcriptional LysR family regulator